MVINADPAARGSTARRSARYAFLAAAAISAVGAAYHVVGGTPEVMYPLYAANLPPESAGILDVLWYQMAALLVGGAVAMLTAAIRKAWRVPVSRIVGGHFLITSGICVIFSFSYFGNAWGLPQWLLFVVIAAIAFWGAGRPDGSQV